MIVRMPEGFYELAMEGLLSVQVIRRLAMNGSQIVRLMTKASDERTRWSKLLVRLVPLERISWLAFLVFHIRSNTYKKDREELAHAILKYNRQPSKHTPSKAEVDCVLWAGFLVLGVPHFENETEPPWLSDIQTMLEKHITSSKQLKEIVKKFFWNEFLSASIVANYHNFKLNNIV